MKILLMILIAGIILFAIAIAFLLYSSIGILEKYPNTEILLSGQTIEPFSSFEGLVEIDFSRDFFIGTTANPHDKQLILSLISENGKDIITTPVEGTFFEKITKVEKGWYKLDITNFGSEPVKVNVLITAHDMRENFETVAEFANYVVVGLILIFPGIILTIVGTGIIIYKKIKS